MKKFSFILSDAKKIIMLIKYISALYKNLDAFLLKNKFEIKEFDSSKSGKIEKIPDIIKFNIDIGNLSSMLASSATSIPIVQCVLPRKLYHLV
jgi:hypothetical protein